jgi:hypothetical protein
MPTTYGCKGDNICCRFAIVYNLIPVNITVKIYAIDIPNNNNEVFVNRYLDGSPSAGVNQVWTK